MSKKKKFVPMTESLALALDQLFKNSNLGSEVIPMPKRHELIEGGLTRGREILPEAERLTSSINAEFLKKFRQYDDKGKEKLFYLPASLFPELSQHPTPRFYLDLLAAIAVTGRVDSEIRSLVKKVQMGDIVAIFKVAAQEMKVKADSEKGSKKNGRSKSARSD